MNGGGFLSKATSIFRCRILEGIKDNEGIIKLGDIRNRWHNFLVPKEGDGKSVKWKFLIFKMR